MARPSSKIIGGRTGSAGSKTASRRRRVGPGAGPGRRVGPGDFNPATGKGRKVGPRTLPVQFDGGKRGKPATTTRTAPGQGPGGRPAPIMPGPKPGPIKINAITQRSMPQGGKDVSGAKARLARRLGK